MAQKKYEEMFSPFERELLRKMASKIMKCPEKIKEDEEY
jgi:hypothetical protein